MSGDDEKIIISHYCSNCKSPCNIKISNSEKNPGRAYWKCCRNCDQNWNGWVEDTCYQKIFCKKCGVKCVIRTTTKGEHVGKQFWSCINHCDVWNGWRELDIDKFKVELVSLDEKKFDKIKKEKNIKDFIIKQKRNICIICGFKYLLDSEINTYLRRYSKYSGIPVNDLKDVLVPDLLDRMKNNKYICNTCVGN